MICKYDMNIDINSSLFDVGSINMMIHYCFGNHDHDEPNPYYITPTIPYHQDYRSFPPCLMTQSIQYQSNEIMESQHIDCLPKNIQHTILQKVIYNQLIEQSNNAYNRLHSLSHIEFEMFNQPCWGLYHINKILDNKFLQDLLTLLK